MKKIKILFYSHTIDYGGTWRSHERILLNLNKEQFVVYVFYNPNQNNNRLDYLKTKLGDDKIIPFEASKEKLGHEYGYPYVKNNFFELCEKYKFDIIHFARSGYYEWPFTQRISPIQIETNIFGGKDNTLFLDYSVSICDTISKLRGGCDEIVYNPIPLPYSDNKDNNLKRILNLNNDTPIFGRIGRKDNFHPIAFESLYKLKKNGLKFKYIIIGACENAINKINELQLNDECVILDTTNDDDLIDKFHNTIDVFLHYRSDGECHSTAISQAMMYGIPVVSHFAGHNGQIETIANGGFVANNINEYSNFISNLISDKIFYKSISNNAKLQSKKFEESLIVSKWEKIYKSLYMKNI